MAGASEFIGGVFGLPTQASATKDAAKTQAESADKATQITWDVYQDQKENFAPFREYGVAGLDYLNYMTTGEGTPFDMEASPMYQWQMERGGEALDKSLAARGLQNSGAAIQAHSNLASELGARESSMMYDRMLDRVKIGTGAASATGGASSMYGANAANIAMQAGANQANIQMQQGRNTANMYRDFDNTALDIYGAGQYNKRFNS